MTRNGGAPDHEPVVRCAGINKFFGGVQALASVSLDVHPAKVLALVGDNGAGKSTLSKVIGGLERPDAGELWYGEHRIERPSPVVARQHGIQTVPQTLALCENLGAAPNILLGQQPTGRGVGPLRFVDRRTSERIARERLAEVGAELSDLFAPIGRMSGGQRQAIAIARAMTGSARLIMFDEPTAALGVRQRRATLALIRRVAERGLAALVISHNVDDVFEVADRVVALRQGRIVLDAEVHETTKEIVTHAMEGLWTA